MIRSIISDECHANEYVITPDIYTDNLIGQHYHSSKLSNSACQNAFGGSYPIKLHDWHQVHFIPDGKDRNFNNFANLIYQTLLN